MPEKKPFITLEQAQEIIADVPTPFHLYDEKKASAPMHALSTKLLHGTKGLRSILPLRQPPTRTCCAS